MGNWDFEELDFYMNKWINKTNCYIFNIICKDQNSIGYKWGLNYGLPIKLLKPKKDIIDQLTSLIDYAIIKNDSNIMIKKLIMNLSIKNKSYIIVNESNKLYTTYFGNLKNLNKDLDIPIAICGKVPNGYTGLVYKKLAPKYKFFIEWEKNKDNNYYIEHYYKEVLELLNPRKVVEELKELAGIKDKNKDKNIYLVCYEKSGEFCHRNLVADWLKEDNIWIKEWGD